ncbi:MAG: DUF4139 domain-containing protein [Spirochaetota bacterium]
MKYIIIFALIILSAEICSAADNEYSSTIQSVKVYQNQALVTRTALVKVKKGDNQIVMTGLPKTLHDWSIKSSLPKDYDGKIMSVKVEQKMLVERFQKKVQDIEDKLKKLRQKDQDYIDDLSSLNTQEKFVKSILSFTETNISKELATRIPQVKVWEDTLSYCSHKNNSIVTTRRRIETAREDLGKEIQKWEFELAQIAGQSYYSNYQVLNKAQVKNRSGMEIQQYAESNAFYAQQVAYLKKPAAGTDIEKRIVLNMFSARDVETKIEFSYLIPNTRWDMAYDVRADRENGKLSLSVYGSIFQKTGEDWENIKLLLSTGAPSNALISPYFAPWYLSIYSPSYGAAESMSDSIKEEKFARKAAPASPPQKAKDSEPAEIPLTQITEKGAYIELELPLKQNLSSTNSSQKKFIKEYNFVPGKSLEFKFELYSWQSCEAFITAEVTNTSEIPWLTGETQVFLDNEYMGKVTLPYIPAGKKDTLVLGMEPRITAQKELVKKYEDAAGVFGGKRRIVYSYQLKVENNIKTETKVLLRDRIPVSQNEKIEVEIKNLSAPFLPAENAEDTGYSQGQRRIVLTMKPNQKTTISYDIVVTFDKDLHISGLE